MNIVVDTSVWSLVIRRREVREEDSYVRAYRDHLARGDCLCLVGPILQEVLSGLGRPHDFTFILENLSLVPVLSLPK